MIKWVALQVPSHLREESFRQLLPLLSMERQEYIAGFKGMEDRLSGLFGGLLIRWLIMERTHLANHQLTFRRDEFGKPFLAGRENIHFNLSHSGEWVAAALDSQPVGVDVEAVEPLDFDVLRTFFLPGNGGLYSCSRKNNRPLIFLPSGR